MTRSARRRSPAGGAPRGAFLPIPPWSVWTVGAILLIIACALAYGNALHAPFVLDDIENIVDNPTLRIGSLSPSSLLHSTQVIGNLGRARPIPYVTFAINYYFGGFDPVGYRVVNIGLLIAAGFAVALFSYLVVRHREERSVATLAAIGAAVLWTLHPLQTNITTYIVQRMTSLAVVSYVISMIFFVLSIRSGRRYLIGCGIFGVFAVLSKEIAYVLPLTLLILWLWMDEEHHLALRRSLWARGVFAAGLLGALGWAAWRYRSGYGQCAFTMTERVLTESRVLIRYLTLFFAPLPSRLNLDYAFPLSHSLFSPLSTLFAIAFHGCAVGWALWSWRKWRLPAALVLLFYVHHLVESTVVPLDLVFEHRTALPNVFLSLLVSLAVVKAMRRSGAGAATVAASFLAVGLVLAGLTHQRNETWKQGKTLWQDVVAKAPGNARGYGNLGKEYLLESDYARAKAALERALAIEPRNGESLVNYGIVLSELGDCDGGLEYFQRAKEAGFAAGDLYYNSAVCYESRGQYDLALTEYSEAVRRAPGIRDARLAMARIHARAGRRDVAVRLALEELRVNPENQEARAFLAVAAQGGQAQ